MLKTAVPNRSTTAALTRAIYASFCICVSPFWMSAASGPVLFVRLLRLRTGHFDHVDQATAFLQPQNVGVASGTPCSDYLRHLRPLFLPLRVVQGLGVRNTAIVLETASLRVGRAISGFNLDCILWGLHFCRVFVCYCRKDAGTVTVRVRVRARIS